MKIATWNIRGLNDLSKQREIRSLVSRLNIHLFCIIETRVKFAKSALTQKAMLSGWEFVSNYNLHYLGRIWICWNKNVLDVAVLSQSS